jgi:peptidoglycan-N-acetylglucosamine deacetylase
MHILTFDIEEWFHILDNPKTSDIDQWRLLPSRLEGGVNQLLDFCDIAGVKATFFILGWVAEQAPDVMAEIARRGHEVGCHSYRHQLVYKQTPREFEHDLTQALERIQTATGIRPKAYRAPGFSITPKSAWAFDILARNGIEIDASVFPANRAHGGLPAFPAGKPCILETGNGNEIKIFPMSFGTILGRRIIFSGGGYFRLLPYRALKFGFSNSDYVMTYFHPRDFDPDQPVVPGLGPARLFKAYVGLDTALEKLQKLTSCFNFIPVGDAASKVNWLEVERIPISKIYST